MSYAPKPDKNGVRWYGKWAGSPKGRREDPARCVEQVHEPGRGFHVHQCNRKRGHGPDGLFCKQHDPAAVKARQEKRQAKRDAERGAHVDALHTRNKVARQWRKKGYTVKCSATKSLMSRGGIGSGHPHIELWVTVYALSVFTPDPDAVAAGEGR